jgi:hypothetical protein
LVARILEHTNVVSTNRSGEWPHTCLIRGAPLEGKRRDARYCSPGCARIMNPGKLLPDP